MNFQSVRESGPHYSEMSKKHWKTITPFGRVITPFRWVITPFQNCVADPKNNKSIWNPPMGVHGAPFPSEILKILKKWCPFIWDTQVFRIPHISQHFIQAGFRTSRPRCGADQLLQRHIGVNLGGKGYWGWCQALVMK